MNESKVFEHYNPAEIRLYYLNKNLNNKYEIHNQQKILNNKQSQRTLGNKV